MPELQNLSVLSVYVGDVLFPVQRIGERRNSGLLQAKILKSSTSWSCSTFHWVQPSLNGLPRCFVLISVPPLGEMSDPGQITQSQSLSFLRKKKKSKEKLLRWFWEYEIILEKHVQIESRKLEVQEPDGGSVKSLSFTKRASEKRLARVTRRASDRIRVRTGTQLLSALSLPLC